MNPSRLLFNTSAGLEALTGLAAVIAPVGVVDLLFGSEIDALGSNLTRVLGIALMALGIAAGEWWTPPAGLNTRVGLGFYNLGVGLWLIYVGWMTPAAGMLLWAIALSHLGLGLIMESIILTTILKPD